MRENSAYLEQRNYKRRNENTSGGKRGYTRYGNSSGETENVKLSNGHWTAVTLVKRIMLNENNISRYAIYICILQVCNNETVDMWMDI